jgi:hypothetical protein
MSSELIIIWRLYWPFVGAVLAIVALLLTRRRLLLTGTDQIELSTLDIPLGFVSLPVSLKQSWFLYGFFTCAAVWSLSFAFTRDYSSFFPSKLRMEVFYDRAGIESALARLGAQSSSPIALAKNWWIARDQYYSLLDREAATDLGNLKEFFANAEGSVHSIGEATFVAKKISGWQNYHIEESNGEVLHTLELPGQPARILLTSFQKLDTSHDYIRPTFTELVVRRTFVIHPRFKQYLSAQRTAASVPFKITVVGMTAVRVFPLPEFSNTVYLADVPNLGLVPIAYTVYIADEGDARGAPE